MKSQVKTPLIIAIALLAVVVLVFVGKRAFSAGDLDQGQGSYTPGVPPWMEKDPAKRGISAHGPGVAAPPTGAPAGSGPDASQHAPPGVGAPTLGNK